MKNPSRQFPLVYVEWHDAYCQPDWIDERTYEKWYNPTCMVTHQVGWLVTEEKDCIVVAARFNPYKGDYGGFQVIPRGWYKIRVLAKPS